MERSAAASAQQLQRSWAFFRHRPRPEGSGLKTFLMPSFASGFTKASSCTQELPENCPYLPLDEQWNNTKERGFLGSAAAAVLGTLQAKLDTLIEDVKTDNKDFVSLHAVDSMFQNTKLPSQSSRPLCCVPWL